MITVSSPVPRCRLKRYTVKELCTDEVRHIMKWYFFGLRRQWQCHIIGMFGDLEDLLQSSVLLLLRFPPARELSLTTVSIRALRWTIGQASACMSRRGRIHFFDHKPLEDVHCVEHHFPDDQDLGPSLIAAISLLPKQWSRILLARSGLGEKISGRTLGKEYGLSHQRIQQIEAKAASRLSDPCYNLFRFYRDLYLKDEWQWMPSKTPRTQQ